MPQHSSRLILEMIAHQGRTLLHGIAGPHEHFVHDAVEGQGRGTGHRRDHLAGQTDLRRGNGMDGTQGKKKGQQAGT